MGNHFIKKFEMGKISKKINADFFFFWHVTGIYASDMHTKYRGQQPGIRTEHSKEEKQKIDYKNSWAVSLIIIIEH